MGLILLDPMIALRSAGNLTSIDESTFFCVSADTVIEIFFRSLFAIVIGVLALIAFAVALGVDLFDTMLDQRRRNQTKSVWNSRKGRAVESFVR